jgi:hypothetical protein
MGDEPLGLGHRSGVFKGSKKQKPSAKELSLQTVNYPVHNPMHIRANPYDMGARTECPQKWQPTA